MRKIALVVIAATFMFACQPEKKETVEETSVEDMVLLEDTPALEDAPVDDTPAEEMYQVRGQLLKIGETDAEGNSVVTVSHEEVPDVMGAMKMDLKTNAAFLSEMAKDDKISFEMVKTEDGYMMRNVAKLPAETELMLVK